MPATPPADAVTVVKDFTLDVPPALVWDILRDFGSVATRLAPGFVTDCRLEGTARICTFANGSVAREELIGWSDAGRCLTYTIPSERLTWHRATAQVFDAPDGGSRFEWTTIVAPAAMASYIAAQMEQGIAAMAGALESVGTTAA